jgi:Mg/Co/Ni transporter MgtE
MLLIYYFTIKSCFILWYTLYGFLSYYSFPLILYIKANNKLIPKPSLLINNTILRILQAIILPEIINTDPAITSEPVITTLSPIIIIIIS